MGAVIGKHGMSGFATAALGLRWGDPARVQRAERGALQRKDTSARSLRRYCAARMGAARPSPPIGASARALRVQK